MKPLSLLILATLLPLAVTARAADLTVQVKGVPSAQGRILVALYDSAANFPRPGATLRAQAADAADPATVVFRDLPPGRYAITAFHDKNGNGQLDRNLAGIPIESFGFSNDAMPVAGPPAFEAAAFELTRPGQIEIQLH